MLFVSFFFKATATFNYWIKGPELGSSASGENGPQFLHSVRCVQSTYVYRGARHLRQSTINIVKCCILWLLVVWRVRVCVNTPSSPDTSTQHHTQGYLWDLQTWRSDLINSHYKWIWVDQSRYLSIYNRYIICCVNKFVWRSHKYSWAQPSTG